MKTWKFSIERSAVVDQQLVKKKISIIHENLNFLNDQKKIITAENIKKNFSLRLQVAYALQTLIQASIDICTHLASDEKWELPDHAAQAFKITLRHGVISSQTADALSQAVRLRNIIVHQYDELDENILENVVQNKLGVFGTFIQELQRWSKKRVG